MHAMHASAFVLLVCVVFASSFEIQLDSRAELQCQPISFVLVGATGSLAKKYLWQV
jgi:hypothetical protein